MQNICLSIVIYLSDFLLFGKSCFHEIPPKLGKVGGFSDGKCPNDIGIA